MKKIEEATKKILIVEDDMIIAMVLEKMIHNLKHSVAGKVISGREAIDKVDEESPDLILMDIQLNDEIDGISVMHEIRKKSDVPVIYITGNSDRFNRVKAKETNYIDYLVKPIQLKELEQSICKAFLY